MQETQVQSLGQEDPLEKEMATHSNILALKKSHGQWSLVGYSPWGARVGHDLATKPPPPQYMHVGQGFVSDTFATV